MMKPILVALAVSLLGASSSKASVKPYAYCFVSFEKNAVADANSCAEITVAHLKGVYSQETTAEIIASLPVPVLVDSCEDATASEKSLPQHRFQSTMTIFENIAKNLCDQLAPL